MANQKITQLASLTTPAAIDLIAIVNISDTSMDPSGTDKKITFASFESSLTLANQLGNIPVSKLNGGTGASSNSFWNGANLWIPVTDALLSLSDISTNNVSSTAHGFAPKSPADATQFLNGASTPAYAQVKDSDLALTDITTNNVSTTKHGFAPKAPNDATKYLDGLGGYSVPPGSGGGWSKLAETTLGSNAATITVSGIPARKNLLIYVCSIGMTAVGSLWFQFNADTAAHYGYKDSLNGSPAVDNNATLVMNITNDDTTNPVHSVVSVMNNSSVPKILRTNSSIGAGTTNSPNMEDMTGTWSNTSSQITSILLGNTGIGNFLAGSWITVYGSDT